MLKLCKKKKNTWNNEKSTGINLCLLFGGSSLIIDVCAKFPDVSGISVDFFPFVVSNWDEDSTEIIIK